MTKRSLPNKDNRIERIQALIKQSLAELFTKEEILDSQNRQVSVIITNVSVSPDIKLAKIFTRPFNREDIDKNEFINLLNSYSRIFFKSLSKILKLKYIPKLTFYYDDSFENFHRISQLLTSSSLSHKTDELLDRD
jgi:ribosome-binding factor A